MNSRSTATEVFVLATAVGLFAAFAAPWMELRGTYEAWRITEWHTFWRGASAFLLSDVVAPGYQVPMEFATASMQETISRLSLLGGVLGAWHGAIFVALVFAGARRRWRGPVARWRVAVQVAVLFALSGLLLYLFALPSNLSPKVDFRGQGDIHVDSLVWSNLNVFPLAPLLGSIAVLVQLGTLAWAGHKRKAGPNA